jgi:hypothetical protein
MVDVICIMVSGDLLIEPDMSYKAIVKKTSKRKKKVKVNRKRKSNEVLKL